MPSTDEELVARSTGGDLDSFNQLVLRWERPIYALAYRVIGREEDARDVCQETFLRAFRALGRLQGAGEVLVLALSDRAEPVPRLDPARAPAARSRRRPRASISIELAGETSPSESIEELVARREIGRAVARAMATLPEEQRTAIILKEYHGLTFQEIADMLDCPLSTVKTRLYQGLTRPAASARTHAACRMGPPEPQSAGTGNNDDV